MLRKILFSILSTVQAILQRILVSNPSESLTSLLARHASPALLLTHTRFLLTNSEDFDHALRFFALSSLLHGLRWMALLPPPSPAILLFEAEELFFKEVYEGVLKRLDDSSEQVRALGFRCLVQLFSLADADDGGVGHLSSTEHASSHVESLKQAVRSFGQYTLEAASVHLDDGDASIGEAAQELVELLVKLFPESSIAYLQSVRSRFHQPRAVQFLREALDG